MAFDEFEELQERVAQGEEFNFYYNNNEFWISHSSNSYHLTRVQGSLTQTFDSAKALFAYGTIEGKALSEIYVDIEW